MFNLQGCKIKGGHPLIEFELIFLCSLLNLWNWSKRIFVWANECLQVLCFNTLKSLAYVVTNTKIIKITWISKDMNQPWQKTSLVLSLNSKHKNQGWEHEVCKIQVQIKLYYGTMKRTKHNYDARLYPKVVLNRLKKLWKLPQFIHC
jgi:hypothetical protein